MKQLFYAVGLAAALAATILTLESSAYKVKENRLIEAAISKHKQEDRPNVTYHVTATPEQVRDLLSYHEQDALIYDSPTAQVYMNDSPAAFDLIYIVSIK